MGLLVASALISIRGGHWPRLAHLLSDWLRGGLIFPVVGPEPWTLLPRCGEGSGASGDPGLAGAGSPHCTSLLDLQGGVRSPSGPPSCFPRPTTPTLSLRLSPCHGRAFGTPLRGAGPGAQHKICPQVASYDGVHTPSRDPSFPSSFPERSSLRVHGHRNRQPWAPFSCARQAPRGLRAPASWALPS